MATYNQKKEQLASLVKVGDFPNHELLLQLCVRFCTSPFPKKIGAATLWLELWSNFSEEGRKRLYELPDPCLNHVESRDRKPERSVHLRTGLSRLLQHDEMLFLEGLRLYPHELCRAGETIGPLSSEMWSEIENVVEQHRLWSVAGVLSDEAFWEAAELLEDYRDLPQPLLDFLEFDRPKEKAPLEEFKDSLQRFLLRKKIEKLRSTTHASLRVHENPLSLGGNI